MTPGQRGAGQRLRTAPDLGVRVLCPLHLVLGDIQHALESEWLLPGYQDGVGAVRLHAGDRRRAWWFELRPCRDRPRPRPVAHAVRRADTVVALRVGGQRAVGVGRVVCARLCQRLPALGSADGGPLQFVAGDGLPLVGRLVPCQLDLVVGERLGAQGGRVRNAGLGLPLHRVGPQAQAAAVPRRHPVPADGSGLQAAVLEGEHRRRRAARAAPAAGPVQRPLHRVAGDCRAALVLRRVPRYIYGVLAVRLRSEVDRRACETGLHLHRAGGPGPRHACRVHGAHPVGTPARLHHRVLVVGGDAVRQHPPLAALELLDLVFHDRQAVQKPDGVPRDGGRSHLRGWVAGRRRSGRTWGRGGPASGSSRRPDGGTVVAGLMVVHRHGIPAGVGYGFAGGLRGVGKVHGIALGTDADLVVLRPGDAHAGGVSGRRAQDESWLERPRGQIVAPDLQFADVPHSGGAVVAALGDADYLRAGGQPGHTRTA